jgi:urease accessory protein
VDVGEGAAALGMEVTVLGRLESGERFADGDCRQTLRIAHRGALLLEDAARLDGLDATGMAGMAGFHVSGLIWAVADPGLDDGLVEAVETAMSAHGPALCGASRLESALLVARVVDARPERARAALAAAWAALRPRLFGRAAVMPRIWNT